MKDQSLQIQLILVPYASLHQMLHYFQQYGAFYSGGSIAFWDLLEKWREAGDFDGLEFSS